MLLDILCDFCGPPRKGQ